MSKENETQVGGSHYQSEFQHWDYAAACFGEGFFKGSATKYISRWRRKGGVQDLEKAGHYMRKLRELYDSGDIKLTVGQAAEGLPQFQSKNGLTDAEYGAMYAVTTANTNMGLLTAILLIDHLIALAREAERPKVAAFEEVKVTPPRSKR